MGKWSKFLGLTILLLAMISCKSATPNLKPEAEPEALNVPPENDPRFSNPVAYPRETLHDDPLKKKRAPAGQQPPGMGSARPGGPGMMR
jgi:hypothetical protein